MDALAKHECKMAITKLFLEQSEDDRQLLTVTFYKTQLGSSYPLILEKGFAPVLYNIIGHLKSGKAGKRTARRLNAEIAKKNVAPPLPPSPAIATPAGLCHDGGIDLSKKRVKNQKKKEEEEKQLPASPIAEPFPLKVGSSEDPELVRQFLLYKEHGLPVLSEGLQKLEEVRFLDLDVAMHENDVQSDEDCIARDVDKVRNSVKVSLLSQLGEEKALSATLVKKNAALQDQLALAQETIRLLNSKLLLTEAELIQLKASFGVTPLPELTREHRAEITRAKGATSLLDQSVFSVPSSTAVSSETFNKQRFQPFNGQ